MGASGFLLVALLSFSIYVIQKSRNIDRGTKRRQWIVVLLMLLIAVVTAVKIIGAF